MIRIQFLLFIIIAFFLSCKTEPPVNDMNVPMGLIGSWNGANQIDLTFYAYNPETNFAGFNIYITDCVFVKDTKVLNNWTDINNVVVSKHVVGSSFDSTINMYILSQTAPLTGVYPTISASDVTSGASGAKALSTKVTYAVKYNPADSLAINNANNYCIGVTAVDMNDFIESYLSNLIKCTGAACNQCGSGVCP